MFSPQVIHRELVSQSATRAFAHGLAHCVLPGDILLLEGDLGAGKTTLLRELAHALGVAPGLVASPTYVLVHIYPLPASCPVPQLAGGTMTHVDAYRLSSADDLEPLGWDQLLIAGKDSAHAPHAAGKSILCVEWPSRIASSLPTAQHAAILTLEHAATPPLAAVEDDEASARSCTLSIPPAWLARESVQNLIDKPPTRCRVTGTWVSPASPTWPFASAKAQGADLFNWLSGNYRVSREQKDDDDASDVQSDERR